MPVTDQPASNHPLAAAPTAPGPEPGRLPWGKKARPLALDGGPQAQRSSRGLFPRSGGQELLGGLPQPEPGGPSLRLRTGTTSPWRPFSAQHLLTPFPEQRGLQPRSSGLTQMSWAISSPVHPCRDRERHREGPARTGRRSDRREPHQHGPGEPLRAGEARTPAVARACPPRPPGASGACWSTSLIADQCLSTVPWDRDRVCGPG